MIKDMIVDLTVIVVAVAGAALVVTIAFALAGHNKGAEIANKYRECRALASIETCVAHVGLEKPARASQR